MCGVRACWAFVHDGKRLAAQWYEYSLMAAGIVFVRRGRARGERDQAPGRVHVPAAAAKLAPLRGLPHHFVADRGGHPQPVRGRFHRFVDGVAVAIAVVHLAGVALALWAFCRAFRRFFSASDLIVPVMATGIVINLAAYMFSIVPSHVVRHQGNPRPCCRSAPSWRAAGRAAAGQGPEVRPC